MAAIVGRRAVGLALGFLVAGLSLACQADEAGSPGAVGGPESPIRDRHWTPPSQTTLTTSPIPSSPAVVDSGLIEKRVGEPGAIGCDGQQEPRCDVLFTVVALEWDPPCVGGSEPLPGRRYLRLEVDANATRKPHFAPTASALALSNWSAEASRGQAVQFVPMMGCSKDVGPIGPLALEPGFNIRGSVVLLIDADIQAILLKYKDTIFRWRVPPS